MEEEMKEVAAFAKDAAEQFGDGKNELSVCDGMADAGGDPFAGLAGAALVAGGAEVPGFAGEGEEFFVAAIGAVESGEAGGEIAAAQEGAHGGHGVGAQGSHGGAVVLFVAGEEIIPGMLDDLPEGRGAGTAGLVDGGHEKCAYEHFSRGARFSEGVITQEAE